MNKVQIQTFVNNSLTHVMKKDKFLALGIFIFFVCFTFAFI